MKQTDFSVVSLWTVSTRNQHGDVVPIQQNLVQLGDSPALTGHLVLGHVLQHHVDEVVKAEQSADHLLIILHYNVHSGADGFINKFQG